MFDLCQFVTMSQIKPPDLVTVCGSKKSRSKSDIRSSITWHRMLKHFICSLLFHSAPQVFK